METARNLPVVVWQEADDDYVADCLLIPRCRARARTREDAIEAVSRLVPGRLHARQVEGWYLPDSYEVGHIPTGGSPLPIRR